MFRAADALIRARFDTVATQLTETAADSVIQQRLHKAQAEYITTSDRVLQTIDAGLRSAAESSDLQSVLELLAQLPTTTTPLLRAELPFRRFDPAARAPAVAPAIQPVYSSDAAPVAGDLGPGPLTPLSEPILRQAEALDYDPVRIFEFVRNQIDSEWYAGAKYGAETTLSLRRGNDTDQASLLIALLRASQIPARYVHGVIELPLAVVADDLALTDGNRVGDALTRAGIAFTPVIRGGRVAAVEVEYTWVAAHVPYSNYRGAMVDFSGPIWLALAPAFKHYQITPASGILQQMAFATQALLDDYLGTPQNREPLDRIRDEIENYLGDNNNYAVQLGSRIIQPEQLQLLPNSLPFAVVAVTAEYQQLPLPCSSRYGCLYRPGFLRSDPARCYAAAGKA